MPLVRQYADRLPRWLILLCLSMRGFCVVGDAKTAIDFTDNMAFQAPSDLAIAFSLGDAFDHIVLCGFVIPHSGDGDDAEGGIGLSVASAVRSHSVGFSA